MNYELGRGNLITVYGFTYSLVYLKQIIFLSI